MTLNRGQINLLNVMIIIRYSVKSHPFPNLKAVPGEALGRETALLGPHFSRVHRAGTITLSFRRHLPYARGDLGKLYSEGGVFLT